MINIAVYLVLLAGLLATTPARAALVNVTDADGLRTAIAAAEPGDVILLAPGVYDLTGSVSCDHSGTPSLPIIVKAPSPGDVRIRFDALEGFKVSGSDWRFENLEVEGVCANHSDCEHAFHVVGAADRFSLLRSVLRDFNAAIKGNGELVGGVRVWPDDVRIAYNKIYNTAPRQTENPVTPIDVVGGRRWRITANFIHDHAKALGNQISYAAFLKGHSFDGVFERNLVICELAHTGQIRLGLSLGGGGTSPDDICEEASCAIEHEGGLLRNNIIVNCPADVGIYLNEAVDTLVYNNLLYNTTGIDARFAVTTAVFRNNLLSGVIRARDGAAIDDASNLVGVSPADFALWFADPAASDFSLLDGAALVDLGVQLAEVTDDFCAHPRTDGHHDLGALEFDSPSPCDTTSYHDDEADAGIDADVDDNEEVCEGVDCSPGSCVSSGYGYPLCSCPEGWHGEGINCVRDDAGVDDPDAEADADAGAPSPKADPGCSCSAGGHAPGAGPMLGPLTFVMWLLHRRRRRV